MFMPPQNAKVISLTVTYIELDCETSDIANSVGTTPGSLDRGESNKNRSLPRSVCQNRGECDILRTLEQPEVTKGASATGVNDTLRDSFVVKSMDLATLVSSI